VRQSEDILSVWNRIDEPKLRERIRCVRSGRLLLSALTSGAYNRDRIRAVLHLPPSTIMEYKSNNGAYARSLSLLPYLKEIHRLHGRQILLPQFNYRSNTTFMTIIIPFFGEARLQMFYHVILYPFLSTRCPRSIRHHVRKGREIVKKY
jgi:hypothetical protein